MSEFGKRLFEAAEERGIWVPSSDPAIDGKVVLRGEILNAVYHQSDETLVVALRLPDGTLRSSCLPKSAFNFHGRRHDSISKEESDREMEKTAAMFRDARGKRVNMEMFRHQAEGAR
jgi:hypothetical protein